MSLKIRQKNKKQIPSAFIGVCVAFVICVVVFVLSLNYFGVINLKLRIFSVDLNSHLKVPKSDNPLYGDKLYVNPNSNAAKQFQAWKTARPNDAVLMNKLALQPVAWWITRPQDLSDLAEFVKAADKSQAAPIISVYYFPNRDCGGYSAGGAKNEADYKNFIQRLVGAIGGKRAIVILEPDAIAQSGNCSSVSEQQAHYSLMSYAVSQLKNSTLASVYIDAGNSNWIKDTYDIADRLKKSGVENADGFSLNVSNFQPTSNSISYGEEISAKLNNKHFVIDTSRNGLGAFKNTKYPEQSWCNPPGRTLGHFPTTETGNKLVDAFLYIKTPGESDGSDQDPLKCFNGPDAGVWWPDYALGLVKRWPKELQP